MIDGSVCSSIDNRLNNSLPATTLKYSIIFFLLTFVIYFCFLSRFYYFLCSTFVVNVSLLIFRVPLPRGGSLVIEQTEALVSIDVNGGHVMFGQGNSQEKAILDVNLEAAKQVC